MVRVATARSSPPLGPIDDGQRCLELYTGDILSCHGIPEDFLCVRQEAHPGLEKGFDEAILCGT